VNFAVCHIASFHWRVEVCIVYTSTAYVRFVPLAISV